MRPLLVVEHGDDVALGRLADVLGASGAHGAGEGSSVDLRRPHAGDALPADLDDHSGLLVLGGRMAAWEDELAPWLPATRSLLAAAVADEVPVLGVCLGAQLLALATGGAVERGAVGPEAGLTLVTATAAGHDDDLVGPLSRRGGGSWLAPQAHGDAVTALPAGAALLASSAAYRVQAFRVGRCAWGVQYHPEVTPGQLDAWLADHGGALAARGTDREQQRRLVAEHEGHLAALARHHGHHLRGAARDAEHRRAR